MNAYELELRQAIRAVEGATETTKVKLTQTTARYLLGLMMRTANANVVCPPLPAAKGVRCRRDAEAARAARVPAD